MRIRPLALGLAGIATFLAAAAAAGEPVRIALLPMSVHAHSSGTEYLSSGLAAMLSARLEQFEGVVVVTGMATPAEHVGVSVLGVGGELSATPLIVFH